MIQRQQRRCGRNHTRTNKGRNKIRPENYSTLSQLKIHPLEHRRGSTPKMWERIRQCHHRLRWVYHEIQLQLRLNKRYHRSTALASTKRHQILHGNPMEHKSQSAAQTIFPKRLSTSFIVNATTTQVRHGCQMYSSHPSPTRALQGQISILNTTARQ